MLKYKCLILDHDDTVVQSEATVNYPFFVEFLKKHRPGMTITAYEYVSECFHPGYIEMCRRRFGFTDEELDLEYSQWKEHIKTTVPAPYPGIEKILRRHREEGGLIVVSSQSAQENILRDYRTHFGVEPDVIFGWDLEPEQRKPSPYALQTVMEKYSLFPADLLVIDDMKPAVQMARAGGVEIAFAGWGRAEFPEICSEMEQLCDFSFYSTEDLAKFLFSAGNG